MSNLLFADVSDTHYVFHISYGILVVLTIPFSFFVKVPMMTLGSHQLKGKVEKLKEPFNVMEKVYDENQQTLKCYKIIGIVKERLIFNQYPKVIMR